MAELPPPLRAIANLSAVRRARSLRLRAVLVVSAVVFLPFVFVTAATGFDTDAGELLRLTLAVVPVALGLGWWLGWRMIMPVEQLRRQVLARTVDAGARGELILDRSDEFGTLATAFNDLLNQLDERNRANETFAADLAHEFKNPVAAIRASAESLESGAVDDARALRLAGILSRSSARLDNLVTQLLELARAEAGMSGAQWTVVDVGTLARGVVDAAALDERWSTVRFVCDTSGVARVHGVVGALETALRNLVHNAASFNDGPGGGDVTVTVTTVGDRVTVQCADSGPGIAKTDLPRVFDRFFTTRGGEKKGTGLGLALVKAVAEAHRGTIDVASEPGKSTCFTLTLWAHSGAAGGGA